MKAIEFIDATLSFSLDKSLFSESVIYKCFYWYLGDYSFDLCDNTNLFRVTLKSKTGKVFDEEELIFRIKNDLADYKLREIISHETQNIRELIIAKALSNYEEEMIISSSISDPVGFDPNAID